MKLRTSCVNSACETRVDSLFICLKTLKIKMLGSVVTSFALRILGDLQNYEGESISNQPNLFSVEIHLFFFDVIAL